MHHLLETWFHWVLTGGYIGIIVLMAMESSIFPVPSEIVIPPAAFLAAQGKTQFHGRGARRRAWVVSWFSYHLLGVPINWTAVDCKVWPFCASDSQKTGASRAMVGSLRGRRNLFRATSSRGSPSDLDSGRHCANEFWSFQSYDDCRISALVLDSGLSRGQSLPRGARAFDEPGCAGPIYSRTVQGDSARGRAFCGFVHVELAADEAALRRIKPSAPRPESRN